MRVLLLYPSWTGAMGVWFTDSSHQVVCTVGDGGFKMNPQKRQTFVVCRNVQSQLQGDRYAAR
jgi:thiamine pyrophosphate-dependent acetolactate synthase large subunit-like protein